MVMMVMMVMITRKQLIKMVDHLQKKHFWPAETIRQRAEEETHQG